MPSLRAQGPSVFERPTGVPSLTVLLHETQTKNTRDLIWLEQKTNIFENPAEKRMEELKKICISQGINCPIIGDAYDEKKKDPTIIR